MHRTWWHFAAFVLLTLLSPYAKSGQRLPVVWAGIGFVTDHQDIARTFPHTHRFLTETSHVCSQNEGACHAPERLLAPKLANLKNNSFEVNIDSLASMAGDTAIALALTIDRELSSHEVIGAHHKLLTEISAQALFFDFKSMQVLASFPILLQHIDVLDHPPDENDRFVRIAALLTESSDTNIHSEFVDAVSRVALKPSYDGHRVRIASVDVSDAAKAHLPEQMSSDVEVLKVSIAQELGKQLFRHLGIPVLPYRKGEAIGGKMSTRMADGRVYALQIPEPDYVIELGLDEFRKVQFSAQTAGSSWIYGAYMSVQLKEPLSNRSYFNQRLKNGETKTVPATQVKVEDWPAYQASLLSLIEKFSAALATPSEEWARRHTGNASSIADLVSAKGVLEKCR